MNLQELNSFVERDFYLITKVSVSALTGFV